MGVLIYSDMLQLTALEQAQAIKNRDVSSVELVNAYLARIEAHNPALNAFVTVQSRRAKRAARLADRAVKRTEPNRLPAFHGVPTGIKDLVPTAWSPTKLGSRAYRYFISPNDGKVARRMFEGGFVSLGKLATSEFGVMPVTEPEIHPPCRNPWALDRSPGGSSGGSGAAVAADLIPIAHGSDGGGSIRIPSAFCHLYGFKPSITLLGNLHGQFNQLGLSVMGPLAHSVEDAAAMLDVLAGRPFLGGKGVSCLAASRQPVGALRIGVLLDSPVLEIDPRIIEATRRAATALEAFGHTLEVLEPPQASIDEFLPVWRFAVSGVPTLSESLVQPVTRWLREVGRVTPYEEARRVQLELVRRIEAIINGFDVILSPTVGLVPPRIGEYDDPTNPEQWFRDSAPIGAMTALFNLTTGPAASLPLELTDDGLPIGVQIGSAVGNDHLLLALSRQLEEALPWRTRRAPGFVAAR